MTDPILDLTRPSVPAIARFRNIDDRGTIVESQAAYPNTKYEGGMQYYFNSIRNASMHRPDGKKLAFINCICATEFVYDIAYLEHEISSGHEYVRRATAEEIYNYKFMIDPRGTMAEEIKTKSEGALRDTLTSEILARLQQGLANGSSIESMMAELAPVQQSDPKQEELPLTKAAMPVALDPLAGTMTAAEKLEWLRNKRAGTITAAGVKIEPLMPAQRPVLQGIVSSDKLAGGEALSGR